MNRITHWKRERAVQKVTQLGPEITKLRALRDSVANSAYMHEGDVHWMTNKLEDLERRRDSYLDYIRTTA